MKTIRSWGDLADYGIVLLTGEACALTYRVLFDLTAQGKRTVEKCFSAKVESEPWNSGEESDPHVASIMLTSEMLEPLSVFALLESGCSEVVVFHSIIMGFNAADEKRPEIKNPKRVFRYGSDGDRNRHQFSGRLI